MLDTLSPVIPPAPAVHAKELLRRLTDKPITTESLADLRFEFNQRSESPEAIEGRAAFREKRKPNWFRPA